MVRPWFESLLDSRCKALMSWISAESSGTRQSLRSCFPTRPSPPADIRCCRRCGAVKAGANDGAGSPFLRTVKSRTAGSPLGSSPPAMAAVATARYQPGNLPRSADPSDESW